jgi:hypothetical protein
MMDFVSWDDDIPNMMGKSENSMLPNHQPDTPLTWQETKVSNATIHHESPIFINFFRW